VLKPHGARMRRRAKKADAKGGKPYGLHEAKAAALDRIKALCTEGLGFYRIAVRMNEEGIPTRTGRPWRGGQSDSDWRGNKPSDFLINFARTTSLSIRPPQRGISDGTTSLYTCLFGRRGQAISA
jgi:hypothetical protein